MANMDNERDFYLQFREAAEGLEQSLSREVLEEMVWLTNTAGPAKAIKMLAVMERILTEMNERSQGELGRTMLRLWALGGIRTELDSDEV